MSTQGHGWAVSLAEFAGNLLAEREITPRARLTVSEVSTFVQNAAVVVYLVTNAEPPEWIPKAYAGDVTLGVASVPFDAPLLSRVAQTRQVMIFQASAVKREDYSHLDLRRTVLSIGYVPILIDEQLLGLIEIVTFDYQLRDAALQPVIKVAEVAAVAFASAIAYERERNTQLDSITRLSSFYDLEKVLNSTLELEELLPIIATKFQDMMNVQALNLWMVESKESLLLMHQVGVDPTTPLGSTQGPGGGIAFEVSESGEPVLIDDPDDPRLRRRNTGVEQGIITSLLAAPLMDREDLVGVVEVMNKNDGTPLDDDDLFMMQTICETANGALHNAALLQTERKAAVLETLVDISGEITSTLNLDRVVQTIVNGPQAVIPFERSALALEQSGRLQLKAISGAKVVNQGDPSISALRDLLEWCSFSTDSIYVTQHDEEISAEREETKAQFHRYFAETGMRAFYARPLTDDQGRVGILSYESSDPDAFTQAHFELIKILAGQATVALRNAQLYQEVPFIGVIEPLMVRKRKFMAMEKRRRVSTMVLAAAAVLFLIFVPLPLRVDGDASVAPLHTAQVQPELDGVVRRVLVHEGDAVRRGSILAEMDDWDLRRDLASAQAKYDIAVSAMNRALATGNSSEAGMQRDQVAYWTSEVARARERLERGKLRSPIDGVVATPQVENFTGRKLDAGDQFAEVINSSHATVDVAVDEQDVRLLQSGSNAVVKLEAFPTRTFRGQVEVISPRSEAREDRRVFFARVDVLNPDGLIRPGMQGRGKVSTGWHPAGYVIFRRPAAWAWGKLWSWFGF